MKAGDTPHEWDNTACHICENCVYFSPAWANRNGRHTCYLNSQETRETLPTLAACDAFIPRHQAK